MIDGETAPVSRGSSPTSYQIGPVLLSPKRGTVPGNLQVRAAPFLWPSTRMKLPEPREFKAHTRPMPCTAKGLPIPFLLLSGVFTECSCWRCYPLVS